jgi:predicted nucleic acid-binding protein
MCSAAAKLKAAHKLSFADAFIVALAQRLDAVLVHKDPEIENLGAVVRRQMPPPKTAS